MTDRGDSLHPMHTATLTVGGVTRPKLPCLMADVEKKGLEGGKF